jgi:hypothetical protein
MERLFYCGDFKRFRLHFVGNNRSEGIMAMVMKIGNEQIARKLLRSYLLPSITSK